MTRSERDQKFTNNLLIKSTTKKSTNKIELVVSCQIHPMGVVFFTNAKITDFKHDYANNL